MSDLDAMRARFGPAFVADASARRTLARLDAANAARRAAGVSDAEWAALWRAILAATHPGEAADGR